MKTNLTLFLILFVLCSHALGQPSLWKTLSESDQYWSVKRSDASGLTLKFNFPQPEITTFRINDQIYSRVSIDTLGSLGSPGTPELPGVSVPFYAPEGSTVSIRWFGKAHKLHLYPPPPPRPTLTKNIEKDTILVREKRIEDPLIYQSASLFPQEPVRISIDACFRQARICALVVEPVLVNPKTGQASYYTDLNVIITFKKSIFKEDEESLRAFTINDDHAQLRPFYKKLGINGKDLLQGRIHMNSRPSFPPKSPRLDHFSSAEAYRVTIHQTGMHVMTRNDLTGAGMLIGTIDPRHLAMYHNDEEIAILVTGEEDGVFHDSDRIVFFGVGAGNEYTDVNIYWLMDKASNGLRMSTVDGTPPALPAEVSFQQTVHFEENHEYWNGIPNGLGLDHWFWSKLIAPTTGNYDFELPFYTQTDQITVRVVFTGFTYSDNHNPDHHVRFLINDSFVSEHYWDGQISVVKEFQAGSSLINTGTNYLQVDLPGDTGAPIDAVFLNYFEIDYQKLFQTDDDDLAFNLTGQGSQQVTISGFSNSEIFVFDRTNHNLVSSVIQGEIEEISGDYRITFGQNVSETHHYEAITLSRLRSIDTIECDVPSHLHDITNGADHIIIAPDAFHEALAPLVLHRQNLGYRVILVSLQDIFDEFSGGVFTPDALTEFLTYTYNYWQLPPPLSVLLVGEANIDVHDYLGLGIPNIIPTYVVEAMLRQSGSDYPYTLLSGKDDIPDIFLGRVTATASNEVAEFVSKVINYENQEIVNNWNSNVLLVADDEPMFEDYLDTLQSSALDSHFLTTNKVYLDSYGSDIAQARQDLFTNIDEGQFLCIYFGHGNVDIWTGDGLLNTSDITYFNNGYRQPLLVCSTCYNGYFAHYSKALCMTEAWLKPQMKGAVVTVASSGLTYTSADDKFHYRLVDQIFSQGSHLAGIAATEALITSYLYDGMPFDILQTQSLLGDPLTKLKVPPATEIPTMSGTGSVLLLVLLSVLLIGKLFPQRSRSNTNKRVSRSGL